MAIEEIYETMEQESQKALDVRDESMATLESTYEPPEQVEMLSERIDTLLDPLSDYMQTAKADSRAYSEERGFLESGFTEGMGEVAAIDSVYEVALGDTYANTFNAYQQNQEKLEGFYQTLGNVAEAQWQQSGQSYINLSMAYAMETAEQEHEYDKTWDEIQHGYTMDSKYLQQTYDQFNMAFYNRNMLANRSLIDYYTIATSEGTAQQKFDSLEEYSKMLDVLSDEEALGKYIQEGESPYSFEDFGPMEFWDVPTIESGAYDFKFRSITHSSALNFVDIIDKSIHEQTSYEERREYTPYLELEMVRDGFDEYENTNPIAHDTIMDWINGVGAETIESDWINTIHTWSRLMTNLQWMDVAETDEEKRQYAQDNYQINGYNTLGVDKDIVPLYSWSGEELIADYYQLNEYGPATYIGQDPQAMYDSQYQWEVDNYDIGQDAYPTLKVFYPEPFFVTSADTLTEEKPLDLEFLYT